MNNDQRVFGSDYMHWAKTNSQARFNLATSGFRDLKLSELKFDVNDLEITTEYGYGYPPLKNAIAKLLDVKSEQVVTAAGTSFANHLAMAAIVNPGDEVLIEQPTYDPLLSVARYLGADVKRFSRRFENGFQIDLHELKQKVSTRTKLIVLTNLHNPSGVLCGEEIVKEIGAIAKRVGCRVLIDEVYLETFFSRRPRTASHFCAEFIVTSSLTKAFGLSGLRCGWIIADEQLANRMWLLNDLFAASPVHVAERLSVAAIDQLGRIAEDVNRILETNRGLLNDFLDSRSDLESIKPEFGTIAFPRVKYGNGMDFCQLLREKYETSVVPGSFFEMPEHFRVGLGGETKTLKEGLERLGQALDEFSQR
jgi:aspartate/methionine/tyrosine aminotransferase